MKRNNILLSAYKYKFSKGFIINLFTLLDNKDNILVTL